MLKPEEAHIKVIYVEFRVKFGKEVYQDGKNGKPRFLISFWVKNRKIYCLKNTCLRQWKVEKSYLALTKDAQQRFL